MKVTIEKKTDQLNYEDFLGGVTRTVKITEVKKGTKEQQYDIGIEGDARWWRPPSTVLKLLVLAWGDDAEDWIGRYATLYGDPEVSFGRDKVGGIRVSHVSHIDRPITAPLTITKGKKDMFGLSPLPRVDQLRADWHHADPERKKAIEAEVAALQKPAEVSAEDAFEEPA